MYIFTVYQWIHIYRLHTRKEFPFSLSHTLMNLMKKPAILSTFIKNAVYLNIQHLSVSCSLCIITFAYMQYYVKFVITKGIKKKITFVSYNNSQISDVWCWHFIGCRLPIFFANGNEPGKQILFYFEQVRLLNLCLLIWNSHLKDLQACGYKEYIKSRIA